MAPPYRGRPGLSFKEAKPVRSCGVNAQDTSLSDFSPAIDEVASVLKVRYGELGANGSPDLSNVLNFFFRNSMLGRIAFISSDLGAGPGVEIGTNIAGPW